MYIKKVSITTTQCKLFGSGVIDPQASVPYPFHDLLAVYC